MRRSPMVARPVATAMSVAVRVSPPNTRARRVIRSPRSAGPTVVAPCGWPSTTMEPPPKPMLNTSGMRKLVRTPPMSTVVEAWRGKPLCRQAHVGGGAADIEHDGLGAARQKAAPRMEFVGPLAKVSTGKRSACAAPMRVPSFWLRYTGR
jgi:hypothetical protein